MSKKKTKAARYKTNSLRKNDSGNFRIFHAVSSAVLLAYESLTSVFGMGTGGSSQLLPPENSYVPEAHSKLHKE